MRLSIKSKGKKDLFCAVFGHLKNLTNLVNIMFYNDHIYIQGMDKSHICLFEINMAANWFDSYILDDADMKQVAINVSIFHKIISSVAVDEIINIFYNAESDNLFVDMNVLLSDGNEKNNVSYKVPLCEYDIDLLSIPEKNDYDAEIVFNSVKICATTLHMMSFGDTVNIICNEDIVKFVVTGDLAEMTMNIPTEDLIEYSVIEDQEVNLLYSLNYFNKMCLSNKLSENIEICIGADNPMKIKYDLGDNSKMVFYLAPKMED